MDTRNKRVKRLSTTAAEAIIRYLKIKGYTAYLREELVWVDGYCGEIKTMGGAMDFTVRENERRRLQA